MTTEPPKLKREAIVWRHRKHVNEGKIATHHTTPSNASVIAVFCGVITWIGYTIVHFFF